MAQYPRPLVLLAGVACLYFFLGNADLAVGAGLMPREGLWVFVLLYSLLALGLIELGCDLAPWRRCWLAGTLVLVSMELTVFIQTNTEAMGRLLETGMPVDPPYPPIPYVGWLGSATWFLACGLIAGWLWALRHRVAAVFWGVIAGAVVLNSLDSVLDFLDWRGQERGDWPFLAKVFEFSLFAARAVGFLLLGLVLIRRELGQADRPGTRAWALLICAVGAAILVGYRAELPFPVVPISLAVASGIWIAYATAGPKPGIVRGVGRFLAGAVLFLLLGEGVQRGCEEFAERWFFRMLTQYPDGMTILLFFATSFTVVLLAGGIWRVAFARPAQARAAQGQPQAAREPSPIEDPEP